MDDRTPEHAAAPRHVALVLAAPVLVALALAGWEGTLVQSSAAAHWSVLAVIALALATAALAGRARQRRGSAEWVRRGATTVWHDLAGPLRRPVSAIVATLAWVVLIAATIGWDLDSFAHQSHDLPTLSRLVGDVTDHQWGRALVFAAWLALGAYLALGGRREPGSGTRRRGS